MLDDGKTLKGAMFDEIRQETGLVVEQSRLVSLGTCFTSVGLLDETLTLYAAHCPEIADAHAGGLEEENEIISNIKVFPIEEVPLNDSKIRLLLQAAKEKRIFSYNEVC